MNKTSRDKMVDHVKRYSNSREHGPVCEVDEATYAEFTRAIGWVNPPTFPRCQPTLEGVPPVTDAREAI